MKTKAGWRQPAMRVDIDEDLLWAIQARNRRVRSIEIAGVTLDIEELFAGEGE